jgi:alcohol dehydrogenase (cytochrome c)
MAAQSLSEREIWQVHSFVRKVTVRAIGADGATGQKQIQTVSVPFEAIRDARKRPGEWLTYAGDYSGKRHTALASITKANVRNLRIEWVAQLRSAEEYLEASPIVHQGRLFVTESPDGLVSLDAGTGKFLWRFRRPVPPVPGCCGSPNRGAAILNDSIFLQTIDSHLVSIDAVTGQKRWEVKLADYRDGYSMTGAPLALRDKIIVGVGGGDMGIRGFISAIRASDGQRLWTFFTIPGPGEIGHETWSGDSWKTGGGATWATGAYDPDSGTVFWGVGNPGPDYQGDQRPGDNLYSNSVVALDEKTGSLRWHFQFTPADEHDWDATQQPVLAEIPWEGKQRPVVLWANRNGFFYVLDRGTGKFLSANSFVKQTWASGFHPNGRPIVREEARPSQTGSLVWPSLDGGTNWWPPSFDSKRLLLFVPTVEGAGIFFRQKEKASLQRGKQFLGGAALYALNHPATIAIKAINVTTGEIRWETRLALAANLPYRRVGGILSTSTGVVFTAYRDEFLALDADTGQALRRIRVGGVINAAPISYEVAGRQFVAVMAGRSLFSFVVQ